MRFKFFWKTIVRMLLLLVSVSMLSFFLVTYSPIDPIDAYLGEARISEEQRDRISEEWGLNKSPVERYVIWGEHILNGDMGESVTYHQPVKKVIAERFKASLWLMGTAWVLTGVIGFLLGILSGSRKNSMVDKFIKTFCLILASTPVFWIGLLVVMVFAVELGWFPLGLAAPVGKLSSEVTLMEKLHHLVLPALTLSITGIANITLHTRQKLIDILSTDYVLFAKARGESSHQIIMRHGLRNICLPAVTLQFYYFSELFGGSVLAEQVFSYPGLGNAVVHAGLHGDAPLLLSVALCSSLFIFFGNLMANITYGVIDPQIREGGKSSV